MAHDTANGTSKPTSQDFVALVSDKWVIAVLHAIRAEQNRYGMMQRHIPDISRKMLTQTLRTLERNGILERIDYEEQPPRVEYSITKLGQSLLEQLTTMCLWSQSHISEVEEAQENYDNTH